MLNPYSVEQTAVKAKVAIVRQGPSSPEILILRRSPEENTRQGKLDLPGGKLTDEDISDRTAPDIDVLAGATRECEEELPGTRLHNLTPIDRREKCVGEQLVITHTLAATATHAVLDGDIPAMNWEHDAGFWMPQPFVAELRSLPGKYRAAIAASELVFYELLAMHPAESPASGAAFVPPAGD
jgi:hypothetical protein